MKRLLSKLPHRHKDAPSDQRPASASRPKSSPEPIQAAPPRATTVFYGADDDISGRPTTASNQRSKTSQPNDSTPSNRASKFGHDKTGESAQDSHDQPGDTPSLSRSDTSTPQSHTKKSEYGLHLGPQDTSLYDDLSYLTLGGGSRDAVESSKKRYSEDVAGRNVMFNERDPLSESHSSRKKSMSIQAPAQADEFSEDVADRNLEPGSSPARSNERKPSSSTALAPWKLKPNQTPISHHVNADSATSGNFDSFSSSLEPGMIMGHGTEASYGNVKRNEKPLPKITSTSTAKTDFNDFDFTNSTDTDVQTRYGPAVTHETVIPEVRHVEEELVTREIHNHDIYHRILPIKETEILPAKHFVRDPLTGNLTEIPAPPGREGEFQNWKIVPIEHGHSGWKPTGPRAFSARTFEADEGMANEYLGEDGVPRSEMTWIHPPIMQDGAQKTGQTEALFLDQLYGPHPKESKPKGIRGGRSDGVDDYDSQFCDEYHDGPGTDKQVRRRPVGAGAGS